MQRRNSQPTTVDAEYLAAASLLTIAEVAALLSLHVETVRQQVRNGELPAVRVGRRALRVPAAYVRQLIDGKP